MKPKKFSFFFSARRLYRRFKFHMNRLGKEAKRPVKILLQVFGIAILYGLLINYVLWVLLNYPFSVRQVLGWGLLYYFLKYEIMDRIVGFLFEFYR